MVLGALRELYHAARRQFIPEERAAWLYLVALRVQKISAEFHPKARHQVHVPLEGMVAARQEHVVKSATYLAGSFTTPGAVTTQKGEHAGRKVFKVAFTKGIVEG